MLSRYKQWVKSHPAVVQNLDWLLLLTVWNPSRTNGGFEFTYEAYHAAVGLLSLWHQNILEEGELPASRPSPYLWLDAIEHLETLIELRGMHLENTGKMNRYGPLLGVEVVKAVLKMAAWSRYSGHLFLRRPSPDDLHHFESEQGLQDILSSLERLRCRYITSTSTSTSIPDTTCCTPVSPNVRPEVVAAPGWDAVCSSSSSSRGEKASCRCGGPTAAGPGPARSCGGGGCSSSSRRGGETYGLRQYVGDLAATLVPPRLLRGFGGSCEKGSGSRAEEHEEEEEQCRAVSGSGCSTSPRAAADAAREVPLWKQPQWRWQEAKWWQWQQLQQQPEAGKGGLGLGVGPAGLGLPGSGVVSEEDPHARMGRNLLWLSELLHIWRPVVYVTLLKRYGRRSWRPWSVSLAVDLLSGHFHRRGRQHLAVAAAAAAAAAAADAASGGGDVFGADGGAKGAARGAVARYGRGRRGTSLLSLALARSLAAPGMTAGEERELNDRRRKLALYALRSPFLEATTLSWLALLRDRTRNLPLLGFGADYLYGLVDTFTAYYCYTSGSN